MSAQNELKAIKEDIVACHSKLKTILPTKGVEVLPSDKMSNLIDNVNAIKVEVHNYPNWYTGKNVWINAGNLPTAIRSATSCAVNNDIYIIGGYNVSGTYVNSNLCYNTIANAYLSKTSMPISKHSYDVASIGTNVYAVCGNYGSYSSKLLNCYDTITNTWSTKVDAYAAVEQNSVCSVGTNLYSFGGYSYSKVLQCYDSKTNTWSRKTDIPIGVQFAIAVKHNKNIFVLGGTTTVSNQCYDTLTDTWSVKANSVSGISKQYSTGDVIGDSIYISQSNVTNDNCVSYNITDNTWSTISAMRYPRWQTFGNAVDDCMYVFGGGNNGSKAQSNVEVYIP